MNVQDIAGISESEAAFDRAWRDCVEGKRAYPPQLEQYLQGWTGDLQGKLLVSLMSIELEYRRTRGDSLKLDDYLRRMPDGESAIRDAFEQLSSEPGDEPSSELSNGVVEAAEAAEDLDGTTIGPYMILRTIGEGGMGVVYEAQQLHPIRRTVALKIIKPGFDTRSAIARFEAERQVLASMDHPNIARVLDAGTTLKLEPYFVMELIKGQPITQYCDDRRLSPRERLELFMPVCQAVQHAHKNGIVHRDLKPSNVLVAEYDGRPVATVIDFGLAKALRKDVTAFETLSELGKVVGTLAYMSPEQASGNQAAVNTSSDVYSLGVLLYELLAGETPIDKGTLQRAILEEILRIIREEDPPLPSVRISRSDLMPSVALNRHLEPKRLVTSLRGELDGVVMKCLEKDSRRRYETVHELLVDLSCFLNDEPLKTARPPSRFYGVRKIVRKHRLTAGAIGMIFLATIGGAGVSLYYARVAGHHARSEEMLRTQERTSHQETQARMWSHIGAGNDAVGRTEEALKNYFQAWQICSDTSPWKVKYERVLLDSLFGGPQTATSVRRQGRRAPYQLLWQAWEPASPPLTEPSSSNAKDPILQVSPDGTKVLLGAANGAVELRDVKSGRVIKSMSERTPDRIAFANFDADGTHIATASQRGIVSFRDAASGEVLWTKRVDFGEILSLSFSANGKVMLAKGLNADEWQLLRTSTGGHELCGIPRGMATCCDLNADGALVLFGLEGIKGREDLEGIEGFEDYEEQGTFWAELFDPCEGGSGAEKLVHDHRIVQCVAVPNTPHIVTRTEDGVVHIWNSTTAAHYAAGSAVTEFEVSPDGRYIATISGKHVQLWNIANGLAVGGAMTLDGAVTCVDFSGDGKHLITGGVNGTVVVWNVSTGHRIGAPMQLGSRVSVVQFSVDGTCALAGGSRGDGTYALARGSRKVDAVVYDQATAAKLTGVQQIGTLLPDAPVTAVDIRSDGKRVLTGSENGTVQEWDASSSREIGRPISVDGEVVSVRYSADASGSRILTGTSRHIAQIWRASDHAPASDPMGTAEVGKGHWHAGFIADDSLLLTVDERIGGRQVFWDLHSGQQIKQPQNLHPTVGDTLRSPAALSPDGKRMIIVSVDCLDFWNAETGVLVRRVKDDADNNALMNPIFSPDSLLMLTLSRDWREFRIWDAGSGQQAGPPITASKGGSFSSAVFNHNGTRLATHDHFGDTVEIWNPLVARRLITIPKGRNLVAFGGDRLVTGGADGARVWDIGQTPVPSNKQAWFEAMLAIRVDDNGHSVDLTDQEIEERWDGLEHDKAWLESLRGFQSRLMTSPSTDGINPESDRPVISK